MTKYQISPWHDTVDLLSPDGQFRACIIEAHELRMGSPRAGLLEVFSVQTGEVLIQIDECNPSIIWSSDSTELFFPKWTRDGNQKLAKLEMGSKNVYYHIDFFSVIEMHSYRDNQLYLTDSPIHKPKNHIIERSKINFDPIKSTQDFFNALGYNGDDVFDVRDAVHYNPSQNKLVEAKKLAYLDWSESCEVLVAQIANLARVSEDFFLPVQPQLKKELSIEVWLPILDGLLVKAKVGKLFLIDTGSESYTIGIAKIEQYREVMRTGRVLSMDMQPVKSVASMGGVFLLALLFGTYWPLSFGLFVLTMLSFIVASKKQMFNLQEQCSNISSGLILGGTLGTGYFLDSLDIFWVWKILLMLLCAIFILVSGFTLMHHLNKKFSLSDFKV